MSKEPKNRDSEPDKSRHRQF